MLAIQASLVTALAAVLVVIGLAMAAQAGTARKVSLTPRVLGIVAGMVVVGLGVLAQQHSPYT